MGLAARIQGRSPAADPRSGGVERVIEAQHDHSAPVNRERPATVEEMRAPFVHVHDNAEVATVFDEKVKASLRAVLAAMWEAEGLLRTARPADALAPENRALTLTGGAIQLRDFKLAAPGASEPAVALPSLDITGISVDGFAPSAAAENVRAKGGHLTLRRDAKGGLNLAALFASAPPEPAVFNANLTFGTSPATAKTPAPRTRPPDVRAAEVALEDFQIDWSDAAAPSPAELHLTGVNVTAKQATLAPGAPVPVSASFGWLPAGTVRLSGAIAIEPLHADLQVDVASLGLAPLAPYLTSAMPFALTSGQATAKGRLVVDLPERGPLALTYGGDASLADLHLRGPDAEALAGLGALTVAGLELATAPKLTVKTTSVSLREPYVHVVRGPDGRINLAAKSPAPAAPAAGSAPGVRVPPATSGATKPVPSESAAELVFPLVEISGGELTFADRSVQPEVKLSVGQLGGTLKNLSSVSADAGAVDLHAVIDAASALAIQGALSPLAPEPHADLKVTFQPLSLQPAAPYVRKYAGYELADGQLKLDTRTALAGGKLDMSNHVTLDQFTLGDPVKSPDATNLPVKLGLALLKDANGRIELDIPVQGSLADPSFQISGVVSHVLTNTLKKAATSPFALLGAMFGGGGEELGRQDFAPGAVEPTAESAKRLETVARALANRPALRVEIEGGYDAAADTPVLQQKKLAAAVRAKAAERGDTQTTAAAPADVPELSAEAYAAALRALFAERFPTPAATAAPAPVTPPRAGGVAAAAPPPSEVAPADGEETTGHRSIWRKALDLATLKPLRERHAEHRAEKKARHEAEERAKQQEAEARQRAAAAASAAPASASAPALSDDEMAAKLAPMFGITPAELQALAQARAETVQEKLMAGGKIAADRVSVKKNDDPATAARLGDHVKLHLQ